MAVRFRHAPKIIFMFKVPNQYRVRKGEFSSNDSAGNNGLFFIPHPKISGYLFAVIAANGGIGLNGAKWEHVSVHLESSTREVDRCPTWQEMCYIKDLFWSGEDCVVQYHPPASQYVNMHPTTLHLWKPVGQALPMPPKEMVGW